MRAQDIMTRDAITVAPSTSGRDAARLMVDHGVSGRPVVDEHGDVVGIVSEGDLIVRQRPRSRVSWSQLFLDDGEQLAREYTKAVGLTCGEVMTREVITVAPETEIEAIAALLDARRIRRVPVVHERRLVGIVSRGDLVKMLAAMPTPAPMEVSIWGMLSSRAEKSAIEAMARSVPGVKDVASHLLVRSIHRPER